MGKKIEPFLAKKHKAQIKSTTRTRYESIPMPVWDDWSFLSDEEKLAEKKRETKLKIKEFYDNNV